MKVSSLAVTGLASFATAAELDKRYKTTVEVECHEKTVTVTAGAQAATAPQAATSTIYTEGDKVTSVDYEWEATSTYLPSAGTYTNPYNPSEVLTADSAKWTDIVVPWTNAYVYPASASQEADATHVLFVGTIVIKTNIVYINVNNHNIISTKTDTPTSTPPPPPPPPATPTGGQGQGQGQGQGDGQVAPPLVDSGKIHRVKVVAVEEGGKTIFRYEPNFVNAEPGAVVAFEFKKLAHSVTESTFDLPCVAKAAGFDTQLIPNPDNLDGEQFTRFFTVTSKEPKWFYCKQRNQNHCKQGMVFALNPGDKMDQFIQNALNSNQFPGSETFSSAPTGATTAAPSATSSGVSSAASSGAPSTVVTEAVSTTAAAGAAQTKTVIVKGNGRDVPFQYDPPRLEDVKPGDLVRFDVRALNHTITQSTIDNPCTLRDRGFNSGFNQFNPDNVPGKFLVDFTMPDADPKYFYCAQGRLNPDTGHCKKGMVFSINAGEERFNRFLANAKAFVPPPAKRRRGRMSLFN